MAIIYQTEIGRVINMARPFKGTTFWDRVNSQLSIKDNGCVEFMGCRDACGYGRINKDGKLVRIHRETWIKERGEIPEGMCVCHKCDNPPCINIEHLFLGTHKENMVDKKSKGRNANTNGEKNPSSKLKSEDIPEIRSRIMSGETCYGIAKDYGVTGEAILSIKHERTWNSVT